MNDDNGGLNNSKSAAPSSFEILHDDTKKREVYRFLTAKLLAARTDGDETRMNECNVAFDDFYASYIIDTRNAPGDFPVTFVELMLN